MLKTNNSNSFRLIRLSLSNHPIFSNTEVEFVDYEDSEPVPYISLIIGPNGTGKSSLLRILFDLFRQIYDAQNGYTQRNIKSSFFLEYAVGSDIYVYSNSIDDELLAEGGVRKRNVIISKNDEFVNISEMYVPDILASSIMVTDKFYFDKANKYPFYSYLGVRTNSNQSGTLSYIRKSIDLMIRSTSINNEFLKKFDRILNVLGFDKRITIKYKISYKSKFLNDKLTINSFKDIFRNWKKHFTNRNTPPFGYNRFITLEKESGKIRDIVAFLNSTRAKGLISKEKDSKVEVLSYDLMDFKMNTSDYNMITELNKLDILRSPSITFYKKGIPLGYKDSSSGEQHIITTLIGLIANVKESSLILLDEPEISLHPNWQMRYINDFIIELFKDYKSCHFVIASHSHFLVSDLKGNSSRIIGLKKEEGNIDTIDFENINTYGWSAEEILYEIFKVKSTRNAFVENDLIHLLDIINRDSRDLNSLREILNRLSELNLSKNDPTNIIIDKGKKYLNNNA